MINTHKKASEYSEAFLYLEKPLLIKNIFKACKL